MDSHGAQWTSALRTFKDGKPDAFYEKCAALLLDMDLYDASDLAQLETDVLKAQLQSVGATPGQVLFLGSFLEQTRQQSAPPPPAKKGVAKLPDGFLDEEEAAAPPEDLDPAVEASMFASPVASVLVPGEENPADVLRRGGMEMSWTSKDGETFKVRKFRETPMPHVVDQDLALPTLYLHFLDKRFFVHEGEYNMTLRAGNDNSELQLVLPENAIPEHVGPALQESLNVVVRFLRSQAEVMSSNVDMKAGAFGPKSNYRATISTNRLYFALQTSRPKAPISLDKKAFGIPQESQLYLFAQNHVSVSFMHRQDKEAFERCINDLPDLGGDVKLFATFLKVFYEGGFAYNQKIEVGGSGYIPKNVGIACMGVVKAFEGQSGISTGYPYLLESRFLPFGDTVPVTIRAITDMSERHARYGLCFTRCVHVWETEALKREGVLNFCSIIPHGGFYYTPKTLRKHWQRGGLVYAFGEAKDELEAPVSESAKINGTETSAAAAPSPAAQQPSQESRRMCVICLSEDAVYATVPCGHLAYCAGCQSSATRDCPVCRSPVRDRIRIY